MWFNHVLFYFILLLQHREIDQPFCTYITIYIYIYIYIYVYIYISNIQSVPEDNGCGLFAYGTYKGFHIILWECSMYGCCYIFPIQVYIIKLKGSATQMVYIDFFFLLLFFIYIHTHTLTRTHTHTHTHTHTYIYRERERKREKERL